MTPLQTELAYLATEASRSERQKAAEEAFDMYVGNQKQYILKNPDETVEEFGKRPKYWLNITRLVVNVLSGLYMDPPDRKILVAGQEDEELSSRFARLWEEVNYNGAWLQWDRITRATGCTGVRVHYDPDYYGPGEGEVVYWYYPSHAMTGLTAPGKPWEVAGLVIKWAYEHPDGTAETAGEIWTPDDFGEIKTAKGKQYVVWKENIYGRIPVTLVRNQDARGVSGRAGTNLFGESEGWDVAESNMRLNERLSDDLYTIKMQGFSLIEMINLADDAEKIVVSPGRAYKFNAPPDAGAVGINFKSPNAPLAELIEDITSRVKQILLANRIPESAITVHLSSGASGIAIVASRTPVLEDRIPRQRLFAGHERELFDLTLDVLDTNEKDFTRQKDTKLELKWPKLDLLSHQERQERREFEIDHGITTPADIAVEDNPDAYIEDGKAPRDVARERIAKNLAEMKEAFPIPPALEGGGDSIDDSDGKVPPQADERPGSAADESEEE